MSRKVADPETGLTPQQEKFCLELARTGNACESYRLAYPNQKMNPNSLAVTASRLQNRPKIALRLSALRSDVRRTNGITLSEHLTTLRDLREEARGVGQLAAAITAEVSRGKVSGLYSDADPDSDSAPVQKVEVRIVDGRRP